mgnify:CR=1 FL=1
MQLNRREFFAGGGAMLAVGCAPCRAARGAGGKEWSLDDGFRLRLGCPGLAEPVKAWVAGDTHLGLRDGRDDAYAGNCSRMAQWPGDAAAFEKLRDTQPMAAVRMGTEEFSPCAVLLPARRTAATFVTDDDRNLSVNPLRRQLGWLADSLGRLNVSTAKLACRVKLTTRDGLEVDLGEATLKAPVSEKTVMAKVRAAMEKRELKGE